MITVQVKTPKEKQAVEIEENAQVRKVCPDFVSLSHWCNAQCFSLKRPYLQSLTTLRSRICASSSRGRSWRTLRTSGPTTSRTGWPSTWWSSREELLPLAERLHLRQVRQHPQQQQQRGQQLQQLLPRPQLQTLGRLPSVSEASEEFQVWSILK